MKKFFIILAISVGIITSADATSTVSPCTSMLRPYDCGNNCCATNAASCKTQCPNIVITECEGLVCENKMTWTNYGDPGKQIKCNTASDTCEYRCNPDGYYRTSVGGGSAMRCAKCPSNATCSRGEYVCCNQGHYPVTNVYMAPGLTGQITEYTCPSCPGYLRYLSATSPAGTYVPGTTDAASCPAAIGACYIPSGTYSGDITGRFQLTGKCHYKES